ncbi:proline-specific peptidase [Sanghuangporus baumii]|uniref:Proline-specific peptidase n=1 Tax=Sanghuangporus baumii TaxID=108892 RepID=A0A9Q5I544_SANBA|nr:proline-specific peptidase [Sanghuangporus baumii]
MQLADRIMETIPGLTGFVDFHYYGETFQTWYRVVGEPRIEACPLVILHGGPAIPNPYLDPHINLATSRNIPVIFYDQIGCGQSTHLREKPAEFFTINLFMNQLDDLLDKLGVSDNFDLYGHSWGGMLVSDYVASRRSKGLKRLIIANAPASIPLFIKCVENLFNKMSPGLAERIRRDEVEGTTDDAEYKKQLNVSS